MKIKDFGQFLNETIKPKKKKVNKKTFIPVRPTMGIIPNPENTDSELLNMNTPRVRCR